MLIPHARDAIHRSWLLRLLSAIGDDRMLMKQLRFKGGTCAAMRNLLDRFSVDLDFDLLSAEEIPMARRHLEKIFQKLRLTIKDQSKIIPQYFLHYDNHESGRSTIALDITVPPPKSNTYEIVYLSDIDRYLPCQTIPTMVANKLVTPLDRFEKHRSIAGRDIYDIHRFLFQGLQWNAAVITERTEMTPKKFFGSLEQFIVDHVTQTIIDQDLNTLLHQSEFRQIRTILKEETVRLVRECIR